jgi:hypothetical protein
MMEFGRVVTCGLLFATMPSVRLKTLSRRLKKKKNYEEGSKQAALQWSSNQKYVRDFDWMQQTAKSCVNLT